MMLAVTSDEQIVLRDGRPFGGEGSFGGTALSWPQPQTLAGMIRTHVGYARGPGYFDNKDNGKETLKIGLSRILPAMLGKKTWLGWTPADMLFTDDGQALKAHLSAYRDLAAAEGSDLPWREWLYPFPLIREKPSSKRPIFLYWPVLEDYLKGKPVASAKPDDLGILSLPVDARIHNGLSSETGTTIQGRLYENRGMHLKVKRGGTGSIDDLAILMDVVGLADGEKPHGSAYLGGDRHTVQINASPLEYPACPDIYSGSALLKLILMTPGDFGAWAPSWLMPDGSQGDLRWVCIPGTEYQVRLRSAMLAGWDGISGWDYVTNKPKAMRKTVRTGSVYVIELREPSKAQEIAGYLWGRALDPDPVRSSDGYGQVIVARMPVTTI